MYINAGERSPSNPRRSKILKAICGGFKKETGEFLGNFFMNLVFCKAELCLKKRSILVCLSLKNLNASVCSFRE